MIFLLLSILASTAIFVLFRSFSKYKVDSLQAIVINYFTACICGLVFNSSKVSISGIVSSDWFYATIILGFLFIFIFYVMALTSQRNGLSVASVATKMSVIIPIIFGIIVYEESTGFFKTTGIILALIAVYLTSIKPKEKIVLNKNIYLPIVLFFGAGIIDTSINYFAPEDKIPLFSATIFAFAALIGTTILFYKSYLKKSQFKLKSIPFGIALGIANYSSIYFLLKALRVKGYESSSIFTINNVAIIAITTLIGLMLFKEKIATNNWIGIIIAILSIILVSSNPL